MTSLAELPSSAAPSLATAVGHHHAGRLAQAELIYREILTKQPDHPDVLHLLGDIHARNDQTDSAIELITRAIELKPDPVFYDTLARALKSRGRFDEAITAYRNAIRLRPDFTAAHNNLGVVLRATGETSTARLAFRAAIAIDPNFAEAHNNLGNLLIESGRFDDAIASCRRAVALKPAYADAHNNLGNALAAAGELPEAIASYRAALQLNSNLPKIWNNLGLVLCEIESTGDSLAAFDRALRLQPNYPQAFNNLGNTLRKTGRLADALTAYQTAINLHPDFPEAHNNLALISWEVGDTDAATAHCNKALQLKKVFPQAHNTLGLIHQSRGDYDRAVAHYQAALDFNPGYADAHSNLSVLLKDQARFEESLHHIRRSIEIRPNHLAHSTLIYLLHFLPGVTPSDIAAEQENWRRLHAQPLASKIIPSARPRPANQKLRIGYVAPYFRRHVIGLNLFPLFRHHDRSQFDIYCYSDVSRPDSITEQFREQATVWRNTFGQSDDHVAQTIRTDQIDILVDLSLHLASNRLLVFARKPAPVQISFAGYPAAAGLNTIDYRITDPFLDPISADAPDFEKPLRIPSFWCYDEAAMTTDVGETPAVNSLPAQTAGHITFGCLNNFCKVNDEVLQLWAKVLAAVPNSRMLLLAPAGTTRRRTANRFAQLGIATDRIEFVGYHPRKEYFNLYHRIDIALDTFPYNGHTTSLDALWMGVPLVTLAGKTPVARAGVSQLTNLNLENLIAGSPQDYITIAASLAADLPPLADLRATLREKMRASPIMDAPRFVREIEKLYRANIPGTIAS